MNRPSRRFRVRFGVLLAVTIAPLPALAGPATPKRVAGDPSANLRGARPGPRELPPGPTSHRELYTFGRVAAVDRDRGWFVVEPANGLDNLWPTTSDARSRVEALQTSNPEAYARILQQQEQIRRDGGVKVWFTDAGLREAGGTEQDVMIDRWVFVLITRNSANGNPTALQVYAYDSLAALVEAQTGQRWNVRDLVEDNVFIVFHEMQLPVEGGAGGTAVGAPGAAPTRPMPPSRVRPAPLPGASRDR